MHIVILWQSRFLFYLTKMRKKWFLFLYTVVAQTMWHCTCPVNRTMHMLLLNKNRVWQTCRLFSLSTDFIVQMADVFMFQYYLYNYNIAYLHIFFHLIRLFSTVETYMCNLLKTIERQEIYFLHYQYIAVFLSLTFFMVSCFH